MRASKQWIWHRQMVRHVVILTANLVLLSACGQPRCEGSEPIVVSGTQAELVDKSLLTQEPCEAPCWNRIVPGETSERDMIAILQDLSFIDPSSLEMVELAASAGGGKIVTWQSVYPGDKAPAGRIILDSSGIVSSVQIERMEYVVTLQELIQGMGDPDGIIGWPYGLPDGPLECVSVSVVWFNEGLQVSTPDLEIDGAENTPLVMPDSPIYEVTYFVPVSGLDEYSEAHDSPYVEDLFIAWRGFGQHDLQSIFTDE